jgi:Flp pilus assembly protein protease CpaA
MLTALCAGMSSAAIVDAVTRRIPNSVCATTAATGVVFAATGIGGISLTSSLLGVTLGFVLMLPGYVFGSMGAGDVKLFASAGSLLGGGRIFQAFLFVAIAGGVLAFVVAWQRGRLARTVRNTAWLCGSPSTARPAIESAAEHNRFPYGPAIAVGCVLAALIPLM